jgi:predicted ATPase
MQHIILTGMPGAGKSTLIDALSTAGFLTVAEAATDIITERQANGVKSPWLSPDFLEAVVSLQVSRRQAMAGAAGALCFYDRSPICTYALATFLGKAPPASLRTAIESMRTEAQYAPVVLCVESLGQIENTPVRQIDFESALSFGEKHRVAYRQFGYQCLSIPNGSVDERLQEVLAVVGS